jgi:hypothetical protein
MQKEKLAEKFFRILKKDWLEILTISLTLGIILLSLGIYLVGNKVTGGNMVLMIGSFLIYTSIIILAFKV